MNNHQYQSRNFDNTDSRSPKRGEGPERCRRCRSYNAADNRRPRSVELMAESNPAESSDRIGSEGDWLKGRGKLGIVSNFCRYFPILLPTKLLYLLCLHLLFATTGSRVSIPMPFHTLVQMSESPFEGTGLPRC